MSKEKVIKILVIFFITILSLLFGINKIFAISINLSDKLDIGPILGSGSFDGDENFNIDNQVLYSDIYRDYSNTTAFKCLEKDSGKCRFGIWNTTVFYLFDLNNEGSKEHSFSTFFNSNVGYLLFYVNDLNTRKIFLTIGSNKKELVDLTNLQSCGNDNPNLCLFAFNFSGFYLNKTGFNGVYLRFVDTYDYGDLSNVSMNRLFLDRTDSTKSEESIFSKLWRGYNEWFIGYDGGYGARISDLQNGVISMGWGYSNSDYAYCMSHDGYFSNLPHSPAHYNCKRYTSDYFKNRVKMLTSIGGPDANILNYTDVVIRDFLAGNKDHLKRTIKDVIGDFKIKGIVSGTGSSSNPENWKDGTFSNHLDLYDCELSQINCHVINFSKVITNAFENIFGDLFELFKNIINFIKDVIKFFTDFIYLAFKGVIDIFDKGQFPYFIENTICNSNYNIDTNILNKPIDILSSDSFSIKENNYKSTFITDGFIDQYLSIIPKSLNSVISLFRVLNPVPPVSGDYLCTYTGLKQIELAKNSFLDVIIALFFFFGIFFLFFKN